MTAIKKTIYISENIFHEAQDLSSNFSALVEAALIAYIHNYKVKKALASFGQWEKRKCDSVTLVNKLRTEESCKNK